MFDDFQALHDFVHTDEVACPGVALGADNLFEVHLVIHPVRHALAYVARPTAGTARTAGGSERYGIFAGEYAYAFQTLLRNDVSCKHVVVFVQDAAQVWDELFDFLLEVGGDVGLHAANRVVIHDEASAAGSFEDVENLFTVAEAVEEGGQCAEIHCQTGVEKQVRVDALQLVHDGTDVLHTFAYLYAHGLFDTHTQGMAVLVSAQVVQTVGQRQCLRVCKAFAHLFDTPVDISAVGIDFFDDFTFQRYAETHYAVGCGVLGTDVHHIFVIAEELRFLVLYRSVRVQFQFGGGINRFLIVHAQRVLCFRVVVFTHRMPYPVVAQVEAAYVGVPYEYHAVEVEHFTLQKVCRFPDVAYRGKFGMLAVECGGADGSPLAGDGGFQLIHHAKSARSVGSVFGGIRFAPVHTGEAFQKVHLFFLPQAQHFVMQGCGFYISYFHTHIHIHSSGRSSFWFTPPKYFSIFTLRCNCIIP